MGMRALIILAGLCLLASPAHVQPAEPGAVRADYAERTTLARHYLQIAQPDLLTGRFAVDHTLAAFSMPRTMEGLNLSLKHAPLSSSPLGRIVYGQLKASFEKGAQRIAPELADALVAAHARILTADELRAMIAFEAEPAQQADEADAAQAAAHRRAFTDALGARWDDELRTGVTAPPNGPPSLDDIRAMMPAEAQAAPPSSRIWEAISAKQNALHIATTRQLNRLWPQAAAAAVADYCAHLRCRASDRRILTGLGKVFADPSNRV